MSIYVYAAPPEEVTDLPEYLRGQLKTVEGAINNTLRFNSSQFLSKDATINRQLKMEGRHVWDVTSSKPVWASGDEPTANWIYGDGSVAYTPV